MSVKLWHNAKNNARDSKRNLAQLMQARIEENHDRAMHREDPAFGHDDSPHGELQGIVDYLEREHEECQRDFADDYEGDLDDTDYWYSDLAREYGA